MRRTIFLIALLVVLILTWGGLRFKDRRTHQWLATARRDELEKYVAAHPDQSEALIRLSILLQNAGESAEAEKVARHAVEVASGNELNWVQFSRAASDDKDSIRGLATFLKENPDSAPVMSELARRTLLLGDASGARTLAEKATKLSPRSPDGWRALGLVMAAQRRMPEAEKALRLALSLHDDTETRLALARILIPLQRYSEIIALCSPIVKAGLSADVSPVQRGRALFYYAGGRLYDPLTAEEIASLQAQLLEADTLADKLPAEERFLPPYFLGESYLRSGKPKEAVPFLERSVALGPMFPGSLYSLARAYRLSGEAAKADAMTARHVRLSRILGDIEMFTNRLEQRPEDAETMLRLAGALAEAGNSSDAAQIYRQLISRGKFEVTAKQRLNELPTRR